MLTGVDQSSSWRKQRIPALAKDSIRQRVNTEALTLIAAMTHCQAEYDFLAEYLLRRKTLDRNDLETRVFVANLSRLLILGRVKPSFNLL